MRRLTVILGAGGQLGEAMTTGLGAAHELVTFTRAELDLTDADAVSRTLTAICPDLVVNCAAYTDVDGAEKNPVSALDVNAWAVQNVARASAEIDATLVHFSTDFVFDGTTDRPYLESDEPNPMGSYAASKLLGEWLAAEAPRHYVLRVESLFGGPNAKSSIDRIISGIESGSEVKAFVDRTVSPSFVDDVVAATASLVRLQSPFGLYHCVNSGWTTWSSLAREIAGIMGRPADRIRDIRMADAGLTALRPAFAALANDKLTAAGIGMPTWQNALARYCERRGQVLN